MLKLLSISCWGQVTKHTDLPGISIRAYTHHYSPIFSYVYPSILTYVYTRLCLRATACMRCNLEMRCNIGGWNNSVGYRTESFDISKYRSFDMSKYRSCDISKFRYVEISKLRYLDISKLRYIEIPNVFCSTSSGIPVLYADTEVKLRCMYQI